MLLPHQANHYLAHKQTLYLTCQAYTEENEKNVYKITTWSCKITCKYSKMLEASNSKNLIICLFIRITTMSMVISGSEGILFMHWLAAGQGR